MFSTNLQTIDKQTDITYQVSAPSGGGLVGSRDFVNLRCWQHIKNGHVSTDTSANAGPSHDGTNPIPMRKTSSDMQLHQHTADDNNIMNQSITSLSKSLGAKVLAADMYTTANEMLQRMDSASVDCDPPPSEQPDDDDNQSEPDEMYVLSGVSVTYDRMPTSAKYIR